MKKIYCLLLVLLLTGCTATYNLDISENGFKENLTISAISTSENDNFIEYPYTIYSDSVANNENPMIKLDGVEYYDSELSSDNDLKKLNYEHTFQLNDFQRSNIVNTSFDTIILKKYDHDEDGEDDYILLSTTDSFSRFQANSQLESVTINIHCHYKIISSNADEVNGNIHTWYFTKNNVKAINMVYDPSKIIDDRTLWEKIKDGEYINIFTISIFIFMIGLMIYYILKKKGERRDEI